MEIIPCLQTGGAERFVIDLSNSFINYGHDVILVTLFSRNNPTLLNELNASIIVVNCGKAKGFDARCYWKINKWIEEHKPDIVHAHIGAIKYTVLSVLLHRKNCRFFATIHSDARREAGRGIELFSRKLLFCKKYMTPITISEESEKSFLDFYGFSGKMIENGASSPSNEIDKLLYKKYHEDVDLLIVNIARINRVKNQSLLIQSVETLNDAGMSIRLLLIGRQDGDDEMMSFIKEHQSDRIIYLGEIYKPRAYYSIADVFCLSSIQEGMPITVIEAFSAGCPVISTPVGGCKNMIKDGENGFLSTNISVDAFSEAIKRFLVLDRDCRIQMSDSCRKDFKERYSINICASNYISLFGGFQ